MRQKLVSVVLVLAMLLSMMSFALAEDIDPDDIAFDGWGEADDLYDEYTAIAEEEYPEEEEQEENINAGDMDEYGEPMEEEEFLDELVGRIESERDSLEAIDGMINILLIGLDARPGEKTGRSDTMILMTLDSDHECIKMISFMRDMYVEIPGRKNNRLNAAYVYGGIDLLKSTLKQNFGVSADYFVAVDFSLLASVIDQIGGLTINVTDKARPRINAVIKQDNKVLHINLNDGLIKSSGEQLLTGKQTEAYARYRFGSSDFERTQRQREVILKAMDKVRSMSLKELAELALNNMDKLTTDMTLSDMLSVAPVAFKLLDAEVREMRVPIDKAYSSKTISGMSVLVPNRDKTLGAITEFLLN